MWVLVLKISKGKNSNYLLNLGTSFKSLCTCSTICCKWGFEKIIYCRVSRSVIITAKDTRDCSAAKVSDFQKYMQVYSTNLKGPHTCMGTTLNLNKRWNNTTLFQSETHQYGQCTESDRANLQKIYREPIMWFAKMTNRLEEIGQSHYENMWEAMLSINFSNTYTIIITQNHVEYAQCEQRAWRKNRLMIAVNVIAWTTATERCRSVLQSKAMKEYCGVKTVASWKRFYKKSEILL